MMDKHVHRRILDILEEMRQDVASATSLRKMRSAEEYISFFRELEEVLRETLSPERQAVYGRLISPLRSGMERFSRKRGTGRRQISSYAEHLDSLSALIREEKEIKKAVVFLPYNASMWDSMESVWKAAAADREHCTAYVVPIPYCDKNPDGSPRAWHCDADRLPKEVPVMDWRTFDLERIHPDVIVFHDPYDDKNFVTSVEPKFYSRNLKKWTDRLVYIPYFVFGEIDINNKRLMAYTGGFAKLPGVIWADVVIVESESVRESYIRALAEGLKMEDRAYWERRILALGSPKIDKVRFLRREDCSLPEDWRRLIAGRKTILYNTSVTEVQLRPKLFLGKVANVLSVFRESKEAVLWWRPHPLMESTIKRMVPELLEGYQKLVEDYRREGYGIYDDTADMHRAIVCSDAFYGDGSSIAKLYRMTGKPVLVQNYGILC